jgi:SAM-dependent methyltransferase
MAYFAQNFGYKVAGVEWAPLAHAKTIENLRLLGIEATVHRADVLAFEGGPFDIVISFGFVEHFPDAGSVLKKLGDLCRLGGYIVTAVPSMEGFNWWISKTFRPSVAVGHYPIGMDGLEEIHNRQGFETVCIRRYGGFFLVSPWEKTTLAKKTPKLARWLGEPVRAWNKTISELTRLTRWYPQPSSVFAGSIYIGRKPEEPMPVL